MSPIHSITQGRAVTPLRAEEEPLELQQANFIAAIQKGDIDQVKTLLAIEDFDPNFFTQDVHTPLMVAIILGHLAVVECLISGGALIELYDGDRSGSALMTAIACDRPLIFHHLIEQGADACYRDAAQEQITPLSLVVLKMSQETMEDYITTLIDSGADIDAIDNFHHTPLMYAARLGCNNIIALLVSHGANINHRNNIQQTPLMLAVIKNHVSTTQILVDMGADLNLQDATGKTALIHAARAPSTACNILIEAGADVNILDNRGANALHSACARCLPTCVEALLNAGAERFHKTDVDGYTPLHLAVIATAVNPNAEECVRLLACRLGKRIKDFEGRTPLDCANFIGCSSEITKLLSEPELCPLSPPLKSPERQRCQSHKRP